MPDFPCHYLRIGSAFSFRSQILSPWLGDVVDSGTGLFYRPASLCSLAMLHRPVRQASLGLRIWLLFSPPLRSIGCRHFFSCPRRLTFWSCQHGRCTDLPRRIRGTEGRRNAQIQPDQKCRVILSRGEVRFKERITINVPLFKKLRDIIFLRDNHFMSHFKGHFEGASTFLTPKLSLAALQPWALNFVPQFLKLN